MVRQHLQLCHSQDGEFCKSWLADIPFHQSIP